MGTDFSNLSMVLDLIRDFVSDALIDTLGIIPFLLITYIILEYIEHKMNDKAQGYIRKAGPFGPIIGAALGIVPQCGFSSAASTFYAGRVITIGTLFAIYLSTSDEMIPIFIAGGIPFQTMLYILIFKFFIGIIFGFIIDAVYRAYKKRNKIEDSKKFEIHKLCELDKCSCNHEGEVKILKPAILHTFEVTVFVFIITFILNIIMSFCGGNEALASFMNGNKYMSVLATSLVGLIPNCAASIIIAQLYVDGVICTGALIAGLLDAAGVGLIVLFRSNRPMWQNIVITFILFLISLIIGLILCTFI